MTEKEVLTELLRYSPSLTTLYGAPEDFADNADWLLENGVTVQKGSIEEIKIVEVGVCVELRIRVKGLPYYFYSHCNFDNEKQARKALEKHGMKEIILGAIE